MLASLAVLACLTILLACRQLETGGLAESRGPLWRCLELFFYDQNFTRSTHGTSKPSALTFGQGKAVGPPPTFSPFHKIPCHIPLAFSFRLDSRAKICHSRGNSGRARPFLRLGD